MSFVSGEFSPADNMQEVGYKDKLIEAAKRTANKAKNAAKRTAKKAKNAAKQKYDNINKKKQIKTLKNELEERLAEYKLRL